MCVTERECVCVFLSLLGVVSLSKLLLIYIFMLVGERWWCVRQWKTGVWYKGKELWGIMRILRGLNVNLWVKYRRWCGGGLLSLVYTLIRKSREQGK